MSEPTLPDIDQSPDAFDTAYSDLLVTQKQDSDSNGNLISDLPESSAGRRFIAKLGNLYDGLHRVFQRRLAEFPDVQTLKALGTDDGIAVGTKARISATGNTWVCATAAASTSTWKPGNADWHVDDYGAIPDNATASGALINACVQDAGPGARLKYNQGTYLLEETLVADQKGQTWVGTGWDTTTGTHLKFDNSVATDQPVVKIDDTHYVTLEEMRLTQSTAWGGSSFSPSLSDGADGILFSGTCGFPTLRNVLINKAVRGIATDTADPTVIFSERFENVYVNGFTKYGVYDNPVNSGNSGGYRHMYITNSGFAALRPIRAYYCQQTRNSQWHINIENAYFTASLAECPVYLGTVDGLTAHWHFEDVTLDADNGSFAMALIRDHGPNVVRHETISVEGLTTSGASGGRYYAITRVSSHPKVAIGKIKIRETSMGSGDALNIVRGAASNSYASGFRLSIGDVASDTSFGQPDGLNLQDSEKLGVIGFGDKRTKIGASNTGEVLARLGLTSSEGTEVLVFDEDVSVGSAAAAHDLNIDIPSGSVILSTQVNLDTAVTGASGAAGVGLGISGTETKYGEASALTKNTKIDTIPDWAVLSGAEDIQLYATDGAGTPTGTIGGSSEVVRVRIVYLALNSLDNT